MNEKASWPIAQLGQAIRHRKAFITIDDFAEYKRCRVQLHAKGIVLRDIISGAGIQTKQQQVCRAGEFLVAEIDAKLGGFGIVPAELDGAIVSSHYFLYEIEESRLDRRFLDYYIRTRGFSRPSRGSRVDQLRRNSASARAWIHHPSPPAGRAAAHRGPHRRFGRAHRGGEGSAGAGDGGGGGDRQNDPLRQTNRHILDSVRELVELRQTDVTVEPDTLYQFAGVYCFGRGVFRSTTKRGSEFSYSRLDTVERERLRLS